MISMFGKAVELYRFRVNCDGKLDELYTDIGSAIRTLNERWNALTDEERKQVFERNQYESNYSIALVKLSYGYSSVPNERNAINIIYKIRDSIELGLVEGV